MIAFLSFVALTQLATKPVTYSGDAKLVGALLSEISSKVGSLLTADRTANREVVLVRVSKMPLDQLMERLARVTSCKWERDGSGFKLEPDDAQRKQEEAIEVDQKVQTMKAGLAQMAAGESPADNAWQPFIAKLCQGIDLAAVATMRPGDRRVWASSDPTPMQLQLHGDPPAVAKQWVDDENRREAQRDKSKIVEGDRNAPRRVDRAVQRLIVTAKLTDSGRAWMDQSDYLRRFDAVQLQASGYESRGDEVLSGSLTLPMVTLESQRLHSEPQSDSIEYSTDSNELLQKLAPLLRQESATSTAEPFTYLPEIATRLFSRPLRRDPLSYAAQEALVALAAADKRDLV
ncbi:MAG TPA: hypothetical protein VG944_08365, partial [Fimbriimonas sp.]|nr:hypothetical protein [Fimbriimonas sp.]